MSKKKTKNGGKLTANWIGTGADGDFFPAHHKKNREYKKIQSIADVPHRDLPDWKEGDTSLGKLKNKKEKKNG